MKKLFLLGLAISLFVACQNNPQRYFDSSPEIETVKAGIKAYEAQDWDTWKNNFADTAKIFHNTHKGASPDELLVGMKQMLSNFSSYEFSKEGAVCEMVIDKEGKTWVNYWNSWQGKARVTDKELIIPVHLTLQFVDGKIVNEYAYYDTAGIGKTIAGIVAHEAMSEEEETVEE